MPSRDSIQDRDLSCSDRKGWNAKCGGSSTGASTELSRSANGFGGTCPCKSEGALLELLHRHARSTVSGRNRTWTKNLSITISNCNRDSNASFRGNPRQWAQIHFAVQLADAIANTRQSQGNGSRRSQVVQTLSVGSETLDARFQI